MVELSGVILSRLKQGGVFVPSPLALDEDLKMDEAYQRLLTLYYIKSGAAAVIPGAHTGEFALNNLDIYKRWLSLIKEMVLEYGENNILMAAAGGANVMKQVELAALYDYDLVMIAPTAFSGKSVEEAVKVIRDIAEIIPAFAFELQQAIPGAYKYNLELWERIFEVTYGAKGASFNTYRSIVMLEAAARSERKDQLALFTGNDDRIVTDLLGHYRFKVDKKSIKVKYHGGLLGHFATDTHAAVQWVSRIFEKRESGEWFFPLSEWDLAHAVNRCNMALFDALGNFENSVWGVKYRLYSLGLLPGPYCRDEKGRSGQAEEIDMIYNEYPEITDNDFIKETIDGLRKEVGLF